MSTVEQVLSHLDADFGAALARWRKWLRIPSISAQPAHAADCRAAAAFARDALAGLGFEAALRETGGHPAVVQAVMGTPGVEALIGVIVAAARACLFRPEPGPAVVAVGETTTGNRSAGARVRLFTGSGPSSSAPSPGT